MNHVLVVEDEEFLIQALKDNLTAEGCVVNTAVNGDEALGQVRRRRPDIILLDLLIPKKDGFDVLEDLKANPEWKSIPVIVLSNLGGDAEIKRALTLGADDYFVKSQHPIQEVVEKVKEYLSGVRPAPRRGESPSVHRERSAPKGSRGVLGDGNAAQNGGAPDGVIDLRKGGRRSRKS